MGKKTYSILPGVPGDFYLGMNVAKATVHAVAPAGDGWHPACETNALRRPVKGRQKARSEYRPLTQAEIDVFEQTRSAMCSQCAVVSDVQEL